HDEFSGEIRLHGQARKFHSPKDAEDYGVAIIHQELASFNHLTVAENLFVGRWPTQYGAVDWPALNAEAAKAIALVGANCAPTDLMSELSVGAQQMIEIAKALIKNSEILIFDEPTSALTQQEVEKLFQLILQLKSQGKGIIYISHKMEEIYRLCD